MRPSLLFIPFLLILASCTHIREVPPEVQTFGSAYSVQPTEKWNGLNNLSFPSISEQWTADGVGLNVIEFWHDIANDQALFERRTVEFPKFRSDMKATDVQELFVSSTTKNGGESVEAMNLRPAKFGSVDGFRFELTFTTRTGLHMRQSVLAAVVDEKLQAISYWGTDVHYFDAYAEEAEKIMASIQLL